MHREFQNKTLDKKSYLEVRNILIIEAVQKMYTLTSLYPLLSCIFEDTKTQINQLRI